MPRILIIDNEECIRESLAIFAEMIEYEPTVAINPAACDVYNPSPCECTKETECTDIFLTNQHMPGMTGLELIQKQLESGCKLAPQCKAVMSGSLTEEETTLATKLNCLVLQKPVTYEVFEKMLNSIEVQKQELVDEG